jgi:hypothetical protein
MIVLLLGLVIAPAHAEETRTARVSGLLFGDYYWIAKSHTETNKDQLGFWIRRAYLTVDNDLSEQFSARLQLEMNQNDFTATSTTASPFLKNAYLKYNHSRHNIFLGISPTPTWNLVETHWGYRSIEKTPLDLYGFGNAVDGGIALWGHFDQGDQWGYQLMVGNGAGTRSETNKDKKYYLALSSEPTKKLVFQFYGDYENGPSSAYTIQGFVGLKGVSGRAGILYAQRNIKQDGSVDQTIDLASLYGVANIKENVALIARVDILLDPNPKADKISYLPMVKDAKSTFYLLGADFKVAEKVNIQPNVELVTYSGDNGSDLLPRVTIFYKF